MYTIGIRLYGLAIIIASWFNPKAKLFVVGRKDIFAKLSRAIKPHEKLVWIHAASSGEFEQARPMIEYLKRHYPELPVFVSFFSPSGYEMHKNYPLADYIYYLPLDTPNNAKKWIATIKPTVAFFIKYEFWDNYLSELNRKNIPAYSVSSVFRDSQAYFKGSGGFGRKTLHKIQHFFTQDAASVALLASIGINNATVIGDTRFDRVYHITQEAKDFPLIEQFTAKHTTIIAGSTWPADEDILLKYINHAVQPHLKLLLVPHEIHESHLVEIEKKIHLPHLRYSQANTNNISNAQVLILDKMGMLSSIYRYGQLAYIGGGFGVGIHNVLEAACYGIPVLFGPNYKKFNEARELIQVKAGSSIANYEELQEALGNLLGDPQHYESVAQHAKEYVLANLGATEKLFSQSFLVNNLFTT